MKNQRTEQAIARPNPQISDEEIRCVLLSSGFKIQDGQVDLSNYIYEAARSLLALANAKAQLAANDSSVSAQTLIHKHRISAPAVQRPTHFGVKHDLEKHAEIASTCAA